MSDVIRMRRHLATPIAVAVWPDGVALRPFSTADAPAMHELLRMAYVDGGGKVEPFADWWTRLAADSEYDPGLCFTAWSSAGLIGVAQCWTSAFVKDLAVHPGWRRRGVGTALLLTASLAFRGRGASSVDLKVQADNAGAIRFYERFGMVAVPD